jgi:soluble cytochrome b562
MFESILATAVNRTRQEAYQQGYQDALTNQPGNYNPGKYNQKPYYTDYRNGFLVAINERMDKLVTQL